MKVSSLIKQLEVIYATFGDKDVVIDANMEIDQICVGAYMSTDESFIIIG